MIDIASQYEREGFAAPIDIFEPDEIAEILAEIETAEAEWGDALQGPGRNNAHYVLPVLDRIAHNPRILDAVEALIGPDILVGGTTLFIKEPETDGFISWHQDARYMGLEPHNWVTAWLAVTDVTEENGCMRMLPGTHHAPLVDHVDTFGENNMLTRGQTVPGVDERKTVPVIMRAGQLSLHHPRVIHGSGPNLSDKRRVGFAIQSYLGGDVEQQFGKIWAQQARGAKRGIAFDAPRPTEPMRKEDVAFRDLTNDELSKIFYRGADKTGKW